MACKRRTLTLPKKHRPKEQHKGKQKSLVELLRSLKESVGLSPVMFTKAGAEIFERMNIETSININGVRLNNPRFADDIQLFADSEEKPKYMLEDLNNKGKRDGMKLNKKKTKIMCNEVARRLRTGVMTDAEQLQEVTEYYYSSRLVRSGNEINQEIDQRITSE